EQPALERTADLEVAVLDRIEQQLDQPEPALDRIGQEARDQIRDVVGLLAGPARELDPPEQPQRVPAGGPAGLLGEREWNALGVRHGYSSLNMRSNLAIRRTSRGWPRTPLRWTRWPSPPARSRSSSSIPSAELST